MIRIEDSIEINAPIEVVFNAERNISLHISTQAARGEKVVDGIQSGLIELGQEVEWEATHFGVRQRLRVRITEMEKPVFFRDDMIKGAFQMMRHDHFFTEAGPDRTIKRDVFCFSAPFGILGRFAEVAFLRRYLTHFLKPKTWSSRDSSNRRAAVKSGRSMHNASAAYAPLIVKRSN
jgi:ligand-binding SRPBCC domain-containing protein